MVECLSPPEAAPLHQPERDGGLAGPRGAHDGHAAVGGQVRRQQLKDLCEEPLAPDEGGGGLALGHLEEQRLQRPTRVTELGEFIWKLEPV